MPVLSDSDPPRSPSLTVITESDIFSEMSFGSLERDMQHDHTPTTVTPGNIELDELNFRPNYSAIDRIIIFQAEKALFRIHAHFFVRDSAHFRDLLSSHISREREDKSPHILIRLGSDVTTVDFERFLAIMYPPVFGRYALITLDEWTSVLHLASKWGFQSIRELAIRELLPLASPVDKIVLGRKYGLHDWLTPAFVTICARAEPPTLAESGRMNGEDVARIFLAREHARASSTVVSMEVAQDAVAFVFGHDVEHAAEVKDMSDHTTFSSKPVSSGLGGSTKPVAPDVPTYNMEANGPPKAEGVDDALMDTLAAWSRLYDIYEDSGFRSDPSPSAWPSNYLKDYDICRKYEAEYQRFLTYIKGSQLRSVSLRRLLSMMLQRDLQCKLPGLCTHLWKVMRDVLKDSPTDVMDGIDYSGRRPGPVAFDNMVNELLIELVRKECARESGSGPFPCRDQLMHPISHLANAGLLNDATLRACIFLLIPSPSHLSVERLQHLCAFLKNHGKTLDRKNCQDHMNSVFAQLRTCALEWRYKEVHKSIVELDIFRRNGWSK